MSGRPTVVLTGGNKTRWKNEQENFQSPHNGFHLELKEWAHLFCPLRFMLRAIFFLEDALQFRRKPINQRSWRALACIRSEGHRNLYRKLSPFSLKKRFKITFSILNPLFFWMDFFFFLLAQAEWRRLRFTIRVEAPKQRLIQNEEHSELKCKARSRLQQSSN